MSNESGMCVWHGPAERDAYESSKDLQSRVRGWLLEQKKSTTIIAGFTSPQEKGVASKERGAEPEVVATGQTRESWRCQGVSPRGLCLLYLEALGELKINS